MHTIENKTWKAAFKTHGAELRSLFHKPSSKELMWQADPAFWGKTSPVLFPIVGVLKDDTYLFNDDRFALSRHGFARDSEFEVRQERDIAIGFALRSDAQSFMVYPFAFELTIRYSLSDNGLTCTYVVHNPSSETSLLFSIGGHPAFAVEVNEHIAYHDYQLLFPDDDVLTVGRLHNNLLMEERTRIELQNHAFPLSYSLFYNDALVIENLESQQVVLANSVNNNQLVFNFHGFPYFGLWAAKNADFVCLEPWAGIADQEHHDQNLQHKKGIVRIDPNSSWEAHWQIGYRAGV